MSVKRFAAALFAFGIFIGAMAAQQQPSRVIAVYPDGAHVTAGTRPGATYGTLADALGKAPAGALIEVPGGYTADLATGLVLATANIHLLCAPGVLLRAAGAAVVPLTITGAGSIVEGCAIDGARNLHPDYKGDGIDVRAPGVVLRNVQISNAGGHGISSAAFGVTIANSSVTGARSAGIYGTGGVSAAATASQSGGVVTAITVDRGGNYPSGQPTVVISDQVGNSAEAVATISGTRDQCRQSGTCTITGLTLKNGGASYAVPPQCRIVDYAGSGGTCSVTMSGMKVASIRLLSGGKGYYAPVVEFLNPPTGSGATASVVMNGTAVASVKVVSGGKGYVAPFVSFVYEAGGIHIENNNVAQTGLDPIYLQDNVDGAKIIGNSVNSTGAGHGSHSIAVHTVAAGTLANGVEIAGNVILSGADNFCIEVGRFSGAPGIANMSNVNIHDNYCKLLVNGNGMVSLNQVSGGTVHRNRMDANGREFGIAFIEFAAADHIQADENEMWGRPPGSRGLHGISIDQSNYITFARNRLEGQIGAGTSTHRWGYSVSNNVIEDNDIVAVPGSSGIRAMIWLQCNVQNCIMRNNVIRNNRIQGNEDPEMIGIALEDDVCAGSATGVIDGTVIEGNQLTNIAQPSPGGGGWLSNFTRCPAVTNTILKDNATHGIAFGTNWFGPNTTAQPIALPVVDAPSPVR